MMLSARTYYRLGFLLSLALAAGGAVALWLGFDGSEAQRIDWLGYFVLVMAGLAGLFGAGDLIAGPLRSIIVKAGPVEINIGGEEGDAP